MHTISFDKISSQIQFTFNLKILRGKHFVSECRMKLISKLGWDFGMGHHTETLHKVVEQLTGF